MILIDWFAPGYKAGGPIQSCVNLAIYLKDDFDVYVLTTDTDHGVSIPYENIIPDKWQSFEDTGIQVYYARKSTFTKKKVKEQLMAIDPDFIYLNLIFSPLFSLYPLWMKTRNRLRGKVILCPRGTLYESALSVKRYKKIPVLRMLKALNIQRYITFHATNEREKRAIQHYFKHPTVIIADNLPNSRQLPFTTCEKKEGSLRCIFIARIVAIKNLLFLLRILAKVKSRVELTIVGPVEEHAYWKECEHAISSLPTNIKASYIGPKIHTLLPPLLQENHLFILPTAGENFGHAIFESFLAGRPVLISNQTPWLNLDKFHAGWDLSLDQPEAFRSVIEKVANFNQEEYDRYALGAWNHARDFINNPSQKEQYLKLIS